MHILTVCTRRTAGLDLWEDTAISQGFTPKILGLGDSRSLSHESKHFGLKFLLLAKHLETLDMNDMCLVTDGFDVIFHNAQSLSAHLDHMPPELLLFAAEAYENPDTGNPYPTRHLRMPFLNSGVYAGRAGAILKVLQPALTNPDILALDDQRYFTKYLFDNPGSIALDHECKLFVCMAGLEKQRDYEVKEGKLVVFGSSFPCVIHFQGFYKDTRIVKELFPHDSRVMLLADSIHRFPSACKREVGDLLVKTGSLLPVPPKYALHSALTLFIGAVLLALLMVTKLLNFL
jgi:hypothetical protein